MIWNRKDNGISAVYVSDKGYEISYATLIHPRIASQSQVVVLFSPDGEWLTASDTHGTLKEYAEKHCAKVTEEASA